MHEVSALLQHEEYLSTNHGNLLASILVRYPQIGTLQVLPHSRCMRFGFFVKGPSDSEPFLEFSKCLSDSIEALVFLAGKQLAVLDMQVSRYEDFSLLELARDMSSLSLQEISLIVSLLEEHFGEGLVCSAEDTEEDLTWYDDFIQHVLEDINNDTPLQELIGFREGGRILVFNKSHASSNS
ncbi:MAG: hypothetical protein GX977_07070 [Firmicutes bacterium]|nr:hypothetical protein [Bacillota bacterium]